MEKNLKIKTSDGHAIYGTWNRTAKKSDKLIVFVHGFTGHANEHFLYNAAHYFPAQGFDTFRFNLYWFEKDARKLTETTISEHTLDLETVLSYFQNDYSEIYLVAHSLGAYVALSIDMYRTKLKKLVLWEPSREPKDIVEHLEFSEALSAYIEHSNVDILIGKKFVEETKGLPLIEALLKECMKPLKIISAEKAGAKIGKNLYFEGANEPKEYYMIEGSGHTFDEEGAERELFEQTLKWIQ